MSHHISCCYCGEILGEIDKDEEMPTRAYHKDCKEEFELDNPHLAEPEEILKDWER